MLFRSLGVVIAIAFGVSISAPAAEAATLTLAPGPAGYYTNLFLLQGGGVYASDGGNPIAPVPYEWPSAGAGQSGSMSLSFGAGGEADVRFSVSLFSDENPYVRTGSYGPSGVPVTFRIDEMSFEFPATADSPAQVSGNFIGLSTTGTIRGSLTVGTTTVPFSDTETGCCAASDGAPDGGLGFRMLSPSHVIVGDSGGPGIFSVPGVGFPSMELITLDEVTFSTGGMLPSFFSLEYVPEPSSTPLLAGVAASLLLLRAKSPRLRREKRPTPS